MIHSLLSWGKIFPQDFLQEKNETFKHRRQFQPAQIRPYQRERKGVKLSEGTEQQKSLHITYKSRPERSLQTFKQHHRTSTSGNELKQRAD